jgi:hypothetical protein
MAKSIAADLWGSKTQNLLDEEAAARESETRVRSGTSLFLKAFPEALSSIATKGGEMLEQVLDALPFEAGSPGATAGVDQVKRNVAAVTEPAAKASVQATQVAGTPQSLPMDLQSASSVAQGMTQRGTNQRLGPDGVEKVNRYTDSGMSTAAAWAAALMESAPEGQLPNVASVGADGRPSGVDALVNAFVSQGGTRDMSNPANRTLLAEVTKAWQKEQSTFADAELSRKKNEAKKKAFEEKQAKAEAAAAKPKSRAQEAHDLAQEKGRQDLEAGKVKIEAERKALEKMDLDLRAGKADVSTKELALKQATDMQALGEKLGVPTLEIQAKAKAFKDAMALDPVGAQKAEIEKNQAAAAKDLADALGGNDRAAMHAKQMEVWDAQMKQWAESTSIDREKLAAESAKAAREMLSMTSVPAGATPKMKAMADAIRKQLETQAKALGVSDINDLAVAQTWMKAKGGGTAPAAAAAPQPAASPAKKSRPVKTVAEVKAAIDAGEKGEPTRFVPGEALRPGDIRIFTHHGQDYIGVYDGQGGWQDPLLHGLRYPQSWPMKKATTQPTTQPS